jgi:hypothetical protein
MFKVGDWVRVSLSNHDWPAGLSGEIVAGNQHRPGENFLICFQGTVPGHNGNGVLPQVLPKDSRQGWWIMPEYLTKVKPPPPILDPLAQELINDYLTT